METAGHIRCSEQGVSGGSWSVGFETPLTACSFVYLKPDTEYEMEVRSKNTDGESEPVRLKVRTNPEGALVLQRRV